MQAVSTTNPQTVTTVTGMARPRVYENRVTTAVRLPEDLHDRLKQAADERDVSVNYLMTKAVDDYLDRLVPAEEAVRAS